MSNTMHPMYAPTSDAQARERTWAQCKKHADTIDQLKRSRALYAHQGADDAIAQVNLGIDNAEWQLTQALHAYNRAGV